MTTITEVCAIIKLEDTRRKLTEPMLEHMTDAEKASYYKTRAESADKIIKGLIPELRATALFKLLVLLK